MEGSPDIATLSELEPLIQQGLRLQAKSTHFASALLAVMVRGQSYTYLLMRVICCIGVSIYPYLRPRLPPKNVAN